MTNSRVVGFGMPTDEGNELVGRIVEAAKKLETFKVMFATTALEKLSYAEGYEAAGYSEVIQSAILAINREASPEYAAEIHSTQLTKASKLLKTILDEIRNDKNE